MVVRQPVSEEDEQTYLEMLNDYECSECGRMDDYEWTEDEALRAIGGDDKGYVRCPDCGAELEQTPEAASDVLAMIAERFPQLAPFAERSAP